MTFFFIFCSFVCVSPKALRKVKPDLCFEKLKFQIKMKLYYRNIAKTAVRNIEKYILYFFRTIEGL